MSMIGVGVKNICYSWREPEFGSHNLHSGSQPFATPILGYPTPFSDLYRCQAHMWYTYIHAGKILIYRNKVSKSQKKQQQQNHNYPEIGNRKISSGKNVPMGIRIEGAVGNQDCVHLDWGCSGNQDPVHLDWGHDGESGPCASGLRVQWYV